MQKINITTYSELIKRLPEEDHSFIIKKENWIKFSEFLDDFLKKHFLYDFLKISRGDLFDLAKKIIYINVLVKPPINPFSIKYLTNILSNVNVPPVPFSLIALFSIKSYPQPKKTLQLSIAYE